MYNEQLPQWDAVGTEPPASKKTAGWDANEKPPAGWFNWLFNRIYKVLQEIQQKVAEKDSPALTGTPTAPTAAAGTSTMQLATTAFVNAEIANDTATKAPLDSPAFTGTPTAPTPADGDNTTKLATTEFVAKNAPKSPRAATIAVAASNSSAAGKASADYVCAGENDQVTINAAITALGAIGGKVVLLEGLFSITAQITVPNNVSIVGQGAGTVIQIPNSNNVAFDMLRNSDTTNGNSGITLSDFTLDGNRANQTTGLSSGIFMIKLSNCIIRNLNVINMRNSGIALSNSTNNQVISNTVKNCASSGSTNAGILISNTSSKNVIANNICQDNLYTGIQLDNTSNNLVAGNVCTGNSAEGIYVSNAGSKQNTITANVCQGNKTNGISIRGSDNAVVGNCSMENSQSSNASFDNIYITGNTNNIQGNTCRQGALTNKPRYGISISSSTATGNLVTNNDLTTGGATGAFSDAGTGTITTAGNKVA